LGVLLLLMASSPALAKPKESKDRGESKDHKIFTTYNWVEEKIEESLSSLQLLYQSLVTRLDDLDEMLAGLFDKNDQQDQYVVQLEEQVSNLEDRVSSLESSPIPLPTPTPIPAPEGITIQFSVDRPQPFNSEWVDVTGYNTIFINASSSEWLHIYGIHYTDDPAMATPLDLSNRQGWIVQIRVLKQCCQLWVNIIAFPQAFHLD